MSAARLLTARKALSVALPLDSAAALLAFLAPLAVYLRTLAPAEVGGDAGEFQVVPAVLGISHPTGYPLYTLLGHLWIALDPVGSVAVRMNALSAVCAALACVGVYAATRAAGGRPLSGLVGAAALALCPLFWRWATIAGVRAAAATFAALVLALAFRWGAAVRAEVTSRPATAVSSGAPTRSAAAAAVAEAGAATRASTDPPAALVWFLWLCFALGLALAHHRSSAFFLPALGLYGLSYALTHRTARRWNWRTIAAGAALLLLPLLLYLYLPIRSALGAPFDQFHPTTWPNFTELVFATQLSRSLLTIPAHDYLPRALQLGTVLRAQFGPLTWLAALGLAAAVRWRPRELLLAGSFGLLICLQVLDWNIGPELNVVYLIPVLVVVALLAACGTEAGLALAGRLRRGAGLDAALVGGVFLLLVTAGLAQHVRGVVGAERAALHLPLDAYHQDLTSGWRGHRLAEASVPYLAPNALIAADWEQATIFWYQKLVARTLPDVAIDYGTGSAADLSPADLAKRYPGRPLYVARSVPWAAGHHPSAAGPLISLSDQPRMAPPPGLTPVNATLDGGMQILGYQLFDERGDRVATLPTSSQIMGIMLVWRAEQRQAHDLSVSLRLVNGSGASVRSDDHASPVDGLAPTTSWAAGEVVGDYYEFDLRGLPAGDYHFQALLYFQPTPGKFQNLHALDAGGKPAGEGVVFGDVRRT